MTRVTPTLAWLFPGQGTQVVGMGQDLYAHSPSARAVFDLADATLGYRLTRLCFEGPAEELQLTVHAQPAIMAASLAALAALREDWKRTQSTALPDPAYAAGHSVGEFTAAVAVGALKPEDGFRLVQIRARLMHEAGRARPGGMVAVLGLDRAAVEAVCAEARAQVEAGYVAVASHNAATQVTIAGDATGLAVAARLADERGARRCVPLAVSAAFHSAAMQPAASALAAAVRGVRLQTPRVALVANGSAQLLVDAAALADELSVQLYRPVLWADTMGLLRAKGVRRFLELGPGQVLTNLVKRLDGELGAHAATDLAGVGAAAAWLAAPA